MKPPPIAKAVTYIWTLPANATGTSTKDTIVVSYNSSVLPGDITVKGINACGTGTVSSLAITINPLPSSALAIAGATTVCQNEDSVVYTVLAIANATSYIWTLPSGATGISSTNSIVVNYGNTASSGNISVRGHNACGDGATLSLFVTVNPAPTVIATATPDTICLGNTSTLNATGATTYEWNSGLISPVIVSPTSTMTYYVTGTWSDGCSASSSVTLVVNNCVGIQETFTDNNIEIYPNPANDNITISDLRFQILNLKINDIIGNTVLEKTLYNKVSTIDISALAKGMYFIKIKTEKGVESRKFVKL